MALDVSTFVDVRTRIAAGGVPRLPFGRGLLVTLDDALPAGGAGKAQLFTNIEGVNEVFDDGDALDAAKVWFSADPFPQGLYIGRWAPVDVATTLTGKTPTVAADAAPLTAANASFRINGNNVSVDLSSATIDTYAEIAAAIQTQIVALGGIFTGATFTYTDNAFVLTLSGADAIEDGYLSRAVDAMGMQVGTDISAALRLDSVSSPDYKLGHDAESVSDAVGEMVGLLTGGGPPVGIMLADDAPLTDPVAGTDTRSELRTLAEAGDYMFGQLDIAAQALVTGDAVSQTALAFAASQGQTLAFYSKDGQKPEVAGLAALSAQNLNNPASIITLHAKAAPGVEATDLTPTQFTELDRKRCNVVTFVGGLPTLVGGYTSRAGYWADAVWWLLWLKNELELSVWNAMRASRRLTGGILADTVSQVLELGVRNGGIMPGGRVNAATKSDVISVTGNDEFDGTMAAGYVLWVESAAERTDLDRENRVGRFKAWLAPSEAIHKVMGDIVLSG